MDKKDLLLLGHLRQDARMSLTKLSKRTGVPVSTIFHKLRSGFNGRILRHAVLVDFSAFGFNLKAFLLLKVKKAEKDALFKKLIASANVNNLFKINNGWDVMLECLFRDLNHLEEFLEDLDESFSIKAKEVHYVLDDIKREAFLADPDLIDLVVG
ncbi:MAG TPA: Lrp/AsnC family transcriptional regulator [Candidatus Woesearchaeota archaeon]|nr:MAG: hypothetical protein DRJ25_00050 [Candidatus Woesearchaeota archaeon]HDD70527.1 Lrp/AsnC family transcriptional regulator [Candidatus Woesearchaeota archaeon]